MAKGDAPVLEALTDINAVSLARTDLDPAMLILVRLAAGSPSRLISRRCWCAMVTAGTAPAGVSAPVRSGPRISLVCAYLWHGQFLSRGRTCEAMAVLFGVPVSPGAVTGMARRIDGKLGACLEAIRRALAAAQWAHFDETGSGWSASRPGSTPPRPGSTR